MYYKISVTPTPSTPALCEEHWMIVVLLSCLSYSSTTLVYICISAALAWGGPQFTITCQEASCRTAQWAVVLQPPAHSSSS